MRFHTVQPISMKLSRNHLLIQGKVDVYFFFWKKTNPTNATGNLRNWPIGLQYLKIVKGVGSEGGRRPSERSYTTLRMFYLSITILRLLPVWLTNRIAAFQNVRRTVSAGRLSCIRRTRVTQVWNLTSLGDNHSSWDSPRWPILNTSRLLDTTATERSSDHEISNEEF